MNIIVLIVIGTSIWVLIDASNIGARTGLVKGIADAGPFTWFIGCLLLWIVVFPMYLAKRGSIKTAAQLSQPAQPAAHQYAPPPLPAIAPANLKACPFCAEPVRKEAIKCKHCGSELAASA